MSNTKLIVLGTLAILMTGWAVFQRHVASRVPASTSPRPLIQGLDPARVHTIVLGVGPNATRLERMGKGFGVANRSKYPATFAAANRLIDECCGIQVAERVSDSATDHADLGVSESAAETIVRFLDGEGRLITGLAIAKSDPKGNRHLRALDSDDVYVGLNVPHLITQPMDFIDHELLKIERELVASVTVGSPDGMYTLQCEGERPDVSPAELPAGKKLKAAEAGKIVYRITNMSIHDVAKAGDDRTKDLKFDWTFTCRLKDGSSYTFALAAANDVHYVTAAADDGQHTSNGSTPTAAERFRARHADWVYVLPTRAASDMRKTLTGLVEDDEPGVTRPPDQPAT